MYKELAMPVHNRVHDMNQNIMIFVIFHLYQFGLIHFATRFLYGRPLYHYASLCWVYMSLHAFGMHVEIASGHTKWIFVGFDFTILALETDSCSDRSRRRIQERVGKDIEDNTLQWRTSLVSRAWTEEAQTKTSQGKNGGQSKESQRTDSWNPTNKIMNYVYLYIIDYMQLYNRITY